MFLKKTEVMTVLEGRNSVISYFTLSILPACSSCLCNVALPFCFYFTYNTYTCTKLFTYMHEILYNTLMLSTPQSFNLVQFFLVPQFALPKCTCVPALVFPLLYQYWSKSMRSQQSQNASPHCVNTHLCFIG